LRQRKEGHEELEDAAPRDGRHNESFLSEPWKQRRPRAVQDDDDQTAEEQKPIHDDFDQVEVSVSNSSLFPARQVNKRFSGRKTHLKTSPMTAHRTAQTQRSTPAKKLSTRTDVGPVPTAQLRSVLKVSALDAARFRASDRSW